MVVLHGLRTGILLYRGLVNFHDLRTSIDLYCMLAHVCQWFAKFQYVGDIWHFGKHFRQLVILLNLRNMLVDLVGLVLVTLRL